MRGKSNRQEPEEEYTCNKTRPDIRNKNKVTAAAVPGSILLAIVLMASLFCFMDRGKTEEYGGLSYEANIVEGAIPGKSREERQRELDSIVGEGMLSMSINATPSGSTTGTDKSINWMIENPSNQGKLIRVEISLEDTGEIIYETGAIPPGNYVEPAPLKKALPPGRYSCVATFYAYREETEDYIGQAAVRIRLVLFEGEEGVGIEETN